MPVAPARIKRPANAFLVFSQEERAKLVGLYKNNPEMSKELGRRWKALSDEDKAPYYQTAKMLKEQHQMEHPDYKYQPRPKRKREQEPNPGGNKRSRTAPYAIPATSSEEKPTKAEDVCAPIGNQWTVENDDKKDPNPFMGASAMTTGFEAYYLPYQQFYNYYNYQYNAYIDTTRPTSTGSASSDFSCSSSSSPCSTDDKPHEYRLENL